MTANHTDIHAWKDAARTHFHRWAEHYDRDVINILLFQPSYRRVLTQLRQWRRRGRQNLRLLDVGCGTGTLLLQALETPGAVLTATGLDMSENMLSKAHEKVEILGLHNRIRLTLGDAEHLPYDDNAFDLITCCNSFHHYPHQDRALAEMFRVLDDDGYLILIDGARDEPIGFFIFEICVARVEGHVHHCTRERMHKLLTQAGFSDIYQNTFGVCPPALLNLARAAK